MRATTLSSRVCFALAPAAVSVFRPHRAPARDQRRSPRPGRWASCNTLAPRSKVPASGRRSAADHAPVRGAPPGSARPSPDLGQPFLTSGIGIQRRGETRPEASAGRRQDSAVSPSTLRAHRVSGQPPQLGVYPINKRCRTHLFLSGHDPCLVPRFTVRSPRELVEGAARAIASAVWRTSSSDSTSPVRW